MLLPQRIVLRASPEPERARREVEIARFGAAAGAPVAAPLAEAGPYRVGGGVVTLWPWVARDRVAGEADGALAAAALAALHDSLRGYAGSLPPYTAALDRVARLLDAPAAVPALSADDRRLLAARLTRLRAATAGAVRWTPLHGDAHPGNLLVGGGRPIWIDFEDACVGPPEYDIACLPPAAWPLFPGVDEPLLRSFAALRSVCVATWCAAQPADAAARAALRHHLGEVRTMGSRDST